MGHIVEDINKPNIYKREHDKYLSGEITEDTFLEWYRSAKNYEPQLPRYNRGLKEKWYDSDPARASGGAYPRCTDRVYKHGTGRKGFGYNG